MNAYVPMPMNAVVYSLPGSDDFTLVHAHDRLLRSNPSTTVGSFVIRPFAVDAGPVFIAADVVKALDPSALHLTLPEAKVKESHTQEAYLTLVDRARKEAAQLGGKVVVSRRIMTGKTVQAGPSLVALRKAHPDAFVYLLHTESFGTWMGASPEVLITQSHGVYATMALAGTRWNDDLFEQKEFDEQMLVTRDIMERLSDTVIEVSDVREHPYGALRHLRTDFRWEDERDAFTFAEKLHPTPAIAGYPRREALTFIAKEEGYDRQLYTGYLGVLDVEESSYVFVNLRCLQLFRGHTFIYAGGGINADSDVKQEWEETERKKESVEKALVYA